MTEVHGRATIRLPLEDCWARLRDLERADAYVPGVQACRIVTEVREGVGARREVVHAQSGRMDETVVDWDEGRGFTLRVHRGEGPMRPFDELLFRYHLEPRGEHTEIETTMRYTMGFGVLGQLLDWLVVRRVSQSNVTGVARALARYYESEAAAS